MAPWAAREAPPDIYAAAPVVARPAMVPITELLDVCVFLLVAFCPHCCDPWIWYSLIRLSQL